MSEEKYIEEAEIVVDLSGGHLAAQAYRKRIKQLQAELDKHRWIPVEERLPKRHKVKEYRSNMVLVCGDNEAWRACWRYDYNQWMNADFYGLQKPTHWKPIILPKGECKQNVFMAREERIAAFHKARGEKWSEEREQWIPKGE